MDSLVQAGTEYDQRPTSLDREETLKVAVERVWRPSPRPQSWYRHHLHVHFVTAKNVASPQINEAFDVLLLADLAPTTHLPDTGPE